MRSIEQGLGNDELLLLLQVSRDRNWNLEDLSNDWGRSKSQPLSQADVDDTIALVQLDPDQSLVLGSVKHIVA